MKFVSDDETGTTSTNVNELLIKSVCMVMFTVT